MRLLLAVMLGSAAAMAAGQATLKVPAGGQLTATLQDAKAVARVKVAPRIVEFQFGHKARGAFRAYSRGEAMPPDRPFIVRARYDAEPPFAKSEITLTGSQFGNRAVAMYKTRENPAILESAEISYGDAKACREGLFACDASEWMREER